MVWTSSLTTICSCNKLWVLFTVPDVKLVERSILSTANLEIIPVLCKLFPKSYAGCADGVQTASVHESPGMPCRHPSSSATVCLCAGHYSPII